MLEERTRTQPNRDLRRLFPLFLIACLPLIAGKAFSAPVAMSGEYGASRDRFLNLPLNPPALPCDPQLSARCHRGALDEGTGFVTDPLGEPSSGVGVPGAGVRIMNGGLGIGDTFTMPPGAFRQNAGPQFAPVGDGDFPGIVQLNTSFSFSLPGTSRAVNPPSATRVFRANAWNAPGNGQTGRQAATTTPISAATQFTHDITLRYRAGPNAFGGTMAALQNGSGRIFVAATQPLNGSTGGFGTSTFPWIGTNQIGEATSNQPGTRHGAGWDYTRMAAAGPAVIKNLGGLAPPLHCLASPGACGLRAGHRFHRLFDRNRPGRNDNQPPLRMDDRNGRSAPDKNAGSWRSLRPTPYGHGL